MIPVHIKRRGAAVPDASVYYIVAQNGLHLHMKNDWVDAVVPVDKVLSLEPEEERGKLLLPPLDAVVFAKAYAFFHSVYKLYHSESAVLLHYSKEKGWDITVPDQDVSSGHVHYDMTERLPGYRCVGTMHSHGSFVARHSSIDDADEAEFDGVHIIVGDFQFAPRFSLEASLVVRGRRFLLDETHVGGVRKLAAEEEPKQFDLPIVMPLYLPPARFAPPQLYTLDLEVLGTWNIPGEWVANVTRRLVPRIRAKRTRKK